MTHTKSNVIQYNEFYNHGSPNANSWTRENSTGNNFLANGGTELNTTSSLYDLDFRNFDPILARMHQVDPMAGKYGSTTPYNFSFNNPVSLNDPSGADPFTRDDYWREIEMQNRNYRKLGDAVTNQIRSSMSSTHVTHITPGSGGNWADGIYYSDWSLHGGSQMYRNGLAAGLIDVGGKLYMAGPGGSLIEAKEENGELTVPVTTTTWREYDGVADRTSYSTTTEMVSVTEARRMGVLNAQMGCQKCLSMEQVATKIQKGGVDTFMEFIKNPNYGPNFFLKEIDKTTTRNSDNKVLSTLAAPAAWAFKAASWGHANFPNPNYDELRHVLTGYLTAEKWGVDRAFDLTMSNELLGLWLDIKTPGPGTAFEWRDVTNNYKGISLWLDHNPWK